MFTPANQVIHVVPVERFETHIYMYNLYYAGMYSPCSLVVVLVNSVMSYQTLVSSPDLIRRVYRFQYNARENDTESDPCWCWFWVRDRD